jgi:hypothetical protein
MIIALLFFVCFSIYSAYTFLNDDLENARLNDMEVSYIGYVEEDDELVKLSGIIESETDAPVQVKYSNKGRELFVNNFYLNDSTGRIYVKFLGGKDDPDIIARTPPHSSGKYEWFENGDFVYVVGKYSGSYSDPAITIEAISSEPGNMFNEDLSSVGIILSFSFAAFLLTAALTFINLLRSNIKGRSDEMKELKEWERTWSKEFIEVFKIVAVSFLVFIPITLFFYYLGGNSGLLYFVIFLFILVISSYAVYIILRRSPYFNNSLYRTHHHPTAQLVEHLVTKLKDYGHLPDSYHLEPAVQNSWRPMIELEKFGVTLVFPSDKYPFETTRLTIRNVTPENEYLVKTVLLPFLDHRISKVHWSRGVKIDDEEREKAWELLEELDNKVKRGKISREEMDKYQKQIDEQMKRSRSDYNSEKKAEFEKRRKKADKTLKELEEIIKERELTPKEMARFKKELDEI